MTEVMISTTTIPPSNVSESLCSQDPANEEIAEALPQNDCPSVRSAPTGGSEMQTFMATTPPRDSEQLPVSDDMRGNETELRPTDNGVEQFPNECTNVLVVADDAGNEQVSCSKQLPQLSNGIKRTLDDCLSGSDSELHIERALAGGDHEGAGKNFLKRRRTITDHDSERRSQQSVLFNDTLRPQTPQKGITTTTETDTDELLSVIEGEEMDTGKDEEGESEGPKLISVEVLKEKFEKDTESLVGEVGPTETPNAPEQANSLKEYNSEVCSEAAEEEEKREDSDNNNTQAVEREKHEADENITDKTEAAATMETSVFDGGANGDSELNLLVEDDDELLDGEEINEDELLADPEESGDKGTKETPVQSEERDPEQDKGTKKMTPESDIAKSLGSPDDLEIRETAIVLQISSEKEPQQEEEHNETAEKPTPTVEMPYTDFDDNEKTSESIENTAQGALVEHVESVKKQQDETIAIGEKEESSEEKGVFEGQLPSVEEEVKVSSAVTEETNFDAPCDPEQCSPVVEVEEALVPESKEIPLEENSKPSVNETSNQSLLNEVLPISGEPLPHEKHIDDVEMMDVGEEDLKSAVQSSTSPSQTPSPVPETLTSASTDSTSSSSTVTLQALSKLKSSFKDFAREDLEALIMEKMVEAILFKSKAAENAKKLKVQEQQIAKMREKLEECERQFKTVGLLFKNASNEVRQHEKRGCKIIPKPILRTVGIQSQTVHQLKCRTCGTKTTTATSIKTAEESSTYTKVVEKNSAQKTPPTTEAATATTKVVQNNPPKTAQSPTGIISVQKTRPPQNGMVALNGRKPVSAPAATPVAAPQQMVVDLTEDDDAHPGSTQAKPLRVSPVAAKPANNHQGSTSIAPSVPPLANQRSASMGPSFPPLINQRSASMGPSVPPLALAKVPHTVANHVPPLRSSQPAQVSTHIIKRGGFWG